MWFLIQLCKGPTVLLGILKASSPKQRKLFFWIFLLGSLQSSNYFLSLLFTPDVSTVIRSDNNVNQVTQQLLTLGHEKKDKPAPLTPRRSFKTPPPPPEPKVTLEEEEEEEEIKNIPSPEEIAKRKGWIEYKLYFKH